jgi:hypothetical protein
LLEIIWLGHFFFQSGALLGKTKAIPRDKTSTICLKLFYLDFFFQSGDLLGKTKSIPRDKTSTICLKLFYLDFFFQSRALFSLRYERDARTSRDKFTTK